MTTTQNCYLNSKPRYEILDGLRGVAAMIVVAFHLLETYSKGPAFQLLNHGYLAVDFFFVLSGFVVGYAYDDRWGRMSLKDFLLRRLVRLHPMVVFGTIVGAVFFYFGASAGFPLIGETPWWKMLLIMVVCCTLLPLPRGCDIRGWGETNPLNGPAWSLQWEYIANLLYALVVRHFSKLLLAVFVIASAVLTLLLALNIDLFGVLAERTDAAYTVIGGWSLSPDQLYIGLTRLLYPFFCGLLISRMGRLIRVRGGFWWCSLLVTAILVMPRIGGEAGWMNGLYEVICILVLFPLVVAMGAGSTISGRRSVAICTFLGAISYPLYITHYPLVYMQMAWAANNPDLPQGTHLMVGAATFVFSIGLAYAAMKLYDLPVREWLRQHLLTKPAKSCK